MAIPARQRWIFYALALALTLVAMRFAGGQDRSDSPPSVAAAQRAERPAREPTTDVGQVDTSPAVRLELLGERAAAAPPGQDPFQSRSWEPPAPVVVALAPPPRPEAPPLPFTYLGKLVEDAQTTLFLAREDRNYVVRTGDIVEGTYRIEEIRDEAAVLVYLPLKSKQTLVFAPGGQSAGGDADPPPKRRGGPRKRPDDEDDED